MRRFLLRCRCRTNLALDPAGPSPEKPASPLVATGSPWSMSVAEMGKVDEEQDDESQPRKKKKKSRRKKPVRQEDCAFCPGDDSANAVGIPEQMISCAKCGSSGKPGALFHFISRRSRSDPYCRTSHLSGFDQAGARPARLRLGMYGLQDVRRLRKEGAKPGESNEPSAEVRSADPATQAELLFCDTCDRGMSG